MTMEEWKEYRLGDVCTKIGSGATPKGGKEAYLGGSTSLIRSQNVLDFSFSWDGLVYINDDQAAKLKGVEIEKHDVLLNITGDSVARACIVPDAVLPARVNQHVSIIRGDKSKVINEFILYYLQHKKQHLLSLSQGGATRNALTKGMIEDLIILLPIITKQQEIVSILKPLDDKIENNRRVNEVLEAQAQALFKSWFVDFEPFKDGEFVESELGRIPQSLQTSHIAEIPHVLETGRRPKGGVGNVPQGIPSIGAEQVKGMGNYDYSKTKYIPKEYAATLKTGKVSGYELLIYKDGGRPGFFIPNFTIFGEGYPFDECYLNEHVFKLDFKDRGYNIFCYFFFRTEYVMNYLNAQGGKAAIPGINRQDIDSILIFSPENELVKKFGAFAEPLFKKMLFNSKQSRILADLRDTLLPRLMSGELQVTDMDLVQEMLTKGIR